ncbi:hypothetical protein DDZ18_13190 [Marinicauda salina]|uniref:Uncharacterized protein n=1 Tax=Marinicauda salina TaxID=2135793 RepID=A0A2U2BQT6_9PROT|nr:hypothetical protein [Marinicauda salina]PWE16372.1 hypothetical protein DDZ18_13190 [Marinicauda salina]
MMIKGSWLRGISMAHRFACQLKPVWGAQTPLGNFAGGFLAFGALLIGACTPSSPNDILTIVIIDERASDASGEPVARICGDAIALRRVENVYVHSEVYRCEGSVDVALADPGGDRVCEAEAEYITRRLGRIVIYYRLMDTRAGCGFISHFSL